MKDGTREHTDLLLLPKQAAATPALAAADLTTLYALDYVPGSTILWSVSKEAWVAHVLSPKGGQPQDRAERLIVDRDGAVWTVMAQRGLLLARPSL
jgi:hypothetical protein